MERLKQYYKHDIIQFKIGRKWLGGKFYYIQTNLPMAPFWSDIIITSCQARVLKTENHGE